MVPTSSFSAAPAEAGAQGRKRSAGPPWVPAFAGMTIIACGYHLLESDHPGIDVKRGERAHLANRGAQPVDLGHQGIGAAVEQVHREEKRSAGNSIAAIIRHAGSMPGLRVRRNALRYSALRLLNSPPATW